MIQIDVNVTSSAGPMLREMIAALTGSQLVELNEQGGRAAVNAAAAYHREYDSAGGWRGKRYMGPSGGDGSGFGAGVARGWSLQSFDRDGAVIGNDADYYAFKVTGGTILPKRAKNLTIPLIPEARGLYASVYAQNTGHRLFTIRGKHALFERLDEITSGARGRRGQAGAAAIRKHPIRAVYALVKSVTMGPWKGALPPEAELSVAFSERFRAGVAEIIENP